jgi:hypothetical protein
MSRHRGRRRAGDRRTDRGLSTAAFASRAFRQVCARPRVAADLPQAVLRLLARERPFNHLSGSRRTPASHGAMNGLLRGAHASIQLDCGLFEQLPGVEGPNTRRQPMQALEGELTRFREARRFAVRTLTCGAPLVRRFALLHLLLCEWSDHGNAPSLVLICLHRGDQRNY